MKPTLLLLFLLLAATLSGCGGQEYTYVDDRDLKTGPGLLSGKDGRFTLYNRHPQQQPEQPDETKTEKSNSEN